MARSRLGHTHDASVLVLTSLTGGPKHGYALTKDIESIAGVSLGPRALYGVLARLDEEGVIEALPSTDRRRPYRITAHGALVLRERLELAATTARVGLGKLGATG